MHIRTLYVFSVTSAENLRKSMVTGVGIFTGVSETSERREYGIIPLLIGIGGLGQSDADGWWTFNE
jgi:hypothetical protein